VVLAARGLRNPDSGDEKIEDSTQAMELRRQARRIHIEAIAAAILLTLLVLYF